MESGLSLHEARVRDEIQVNLCNLPFTLSEEVCVSARTHLDNQLGVQAVEGGVGAVSESADSVGELPVCRHEA